MLPHANPEAPRTNPTSQTLPAPGQAIVRWLPCDTMQDHWLESLDQAERDRAARFRFATDRASYVAAHALARTMLERWGGLPAAMWRFIPGPFGKPAIDPAHGRDWLRFNISHTRGMAACALLRDVDIGVDIEALDRKHDGPAIAERFFGPEEIGHLTRPDPPADTFLRLWTMKECVMKATGQGFNLPLDAFAVTLEPLGVSFRDGPRGPWSFDQQTAGPRHMLAAAARAPAVRFDVGPL